LTSEQKGKCLGRPDEKWGNYFEGKKRKIGREIPDSYIQVFDDERSEKHNTLQQNERTIRNS
jgi:hypothetical protein